MNSKTLRWCRTFYLYLSGGGRSILYALYTGTEWRTSGRTGLLSNPTTTTATVKNLVPFHTPNHSRHCLILRLEQKRWLMSQFNGKKTESMNATNLPLLRQGWTPNLPYLVRRDAHRVTLGCPQGRKVGLEVRLGCGYWEYKVWLSLTHQQLLVFIYSFI